MDISARCRFLSCHYFNLILILWLQVGLPQAGSAQNFISEDDYLVNGFNSKLTGLDFNYHSCIPGLHESILVRATDGKDFLEWETEEVPEGIKKKYTTFLWIAALGSSPGNARMDLSINGKLCFSFYTDGKPYWNLKGDNGYLLSFNSIMLDQYGDHHGYMVLRLPVEKVQVGKPVRIMVSGSAANLSSWYMTYRKQVRTGVVLHPFPAILKNGNEPKQLVEAGIFYFGLPVEAKIYSDNKLLGIFPLKTGYNVVNLGLNPVSEPTQVKITIIAGDFSESKVLVLLPVKPWQISLIQHSHTDIGYTRPQYEILAEHLRYIDYALDYCDATDSFPENAKFRWTCEASWPVDEYLKCRPAGQIERLIKRVREGRIEVTAMYYNFSELPDEQILAASLEATGRIKDHGIPVTLAMQNDVNGIGWCMNDYFSTLGIRYLNMGTHGHRALICFDKPTMFWWESPSGKRILAFRAEHYMTGNTVLEMQTGDIDRFKNNLLNYLTELDGKDYPYDKIAIQHSGYLTDNSPPSITASKLITQWNQLFEWPLLTTSTAESFFHDMERRYGSGFPVIRGAWPDWWADGLAASAREVATTRQAATSLMANMGGLSMASVSGLILPEKTDESINLANNALLFYSEHTTGYSESVREPLSGPTMEQRALKESYAWEATRRVAMLGEEALGLLQSLFGREPDPSFLAFNTLNWERSGLTTVYIDHQIIPRGKVPGFFDQDGKRLAVQALSHRSDGTYWAVCLQDIPAFGYRKYHIRPLDDSASQPVRNPVDVLENKWYRVNLKPENGTIGSLYDKTLSKELIDQASIYKLGEFILEQLDNREQLEAKYLRNFRRLSPDSVWFDNYSSGEVWNSIRYYGETETTVGPRGFSFELRLFNHEKRVDLAYSIVKKNITEPEGIYIAFPFSSACGQHHTELPGGVIETGKDQIIGSSNDWYTVQNFTSLRNSGFQVVLGCSEMPLMQFGNINTGRFTAGAMPVSSHLFSWPMNNYWTTNFNADQRGGHSWTYYLTSSGDVSNGFATKFGWGCRVPFLTRIVPGSGNSAKDNNFDLSGSFITGWPQNAVLISAKPSGNRSLLIHLRETDGKNAPIILYNGLTGKVLQVSATDVNGEPVKGINTILGPLESGFYKVNF
ncbi:MAG: glycoside hydrolase family 38 C-terminal domain-containing protein [Bacteroidota bacterium]